MSTAVAYSTRQIPSHSAGEGASPFHLRLYAEILLLRHASLDDAQIVGALGNSFVDLNPHQVSAALKAYKGPLQTGRGMLLADEVGLGKTIEALLVVAQFWAMHRRRILLLVPASLRAQWKTEIEDKFSLSAEILDKSSVRRVVSENYAPGRISRGVAIATPQFAYRNLDLLKGIDWDLVVIDEAHRLRNVHQGSKTAAALKGAFEAAPKLLLTATPLQNHLDELYGLMSFIDPNLLGKLETFRFLYGNGENLGELRSRIDPYLARTLRRQVQEYVRFTHRHCMIQEYHAGPLEMQLHDAMAGFLQRDRIPAFRIDEHKRGARNFVLMAYWRLLGSSSAAIRGALAGLAERLERYLASGRWEMPLPLRVGEDEEDEGAEEDQSDPPAEFSLEEVRADLALVQQLLAVAERAEREEHGKLDGLIRALRSLFADAEASDRPPKAVIFTEFLRTQEYLAEQLAEAGFAGEITIFNGKSGDAQKRRERIEEFRTRTKIFISTEAGAEGLNLQFCRVVINYDLPWNPQRVEQRIGRCHRYGQEHDVVVANLVSHDNEAERRLHELLQQKLGLFDGLFSSSDDILGALERGVDFEERILAILQRCRTREEIAEDFARLQRDCETTITQTMTSTREQVLDTFDEEVASRLSGLQEYLPGELHRQEMMLRYVVTHAVGDQLVPVELDGAVETFRLEQDGEATLVMFNRIPRDVLPEVERIHLSHPVAASALERLRKAPPALADVKIEVPHTPRITYLEDLYRDGARNGEWFVYRLSAEGVEAVDELVHVISFVDGRPALTGEAAGTFVRAIPRGGVSIQRREITEPASALIQDAQDRFEERLQELYGGLYFQRREEMDLRMWDEQERMQARAQELEKSFRDAHRRAKKERGFKERKDLADEADRLERELRRAREAENEFLNELSRQKSRELARLDSLVNLRHHEPVLVGACRWTLIANAAPSPGDDR